MLVYIRKRLVLGRKRIYRQRCDKRQMWYVVHHHHVINHPFLFLLAFLIGMRYLTSKVDIEGFDGGASPEKASGDITEADAEPIRAQVQIFEAPHARHYVADVEPLQISQLKDDFSSSSPGADIVSVVWWMK